MNDYKIKYKILKYKSKLNKMQQGGQEPLNCEKMSALIMNMLNNDNNHYKSVQQIKYNKYIFDQKTFRAHCQNNKDNDINPDTQFIVEFNIEDGYETDPIVYLYPKDWT